MKFRTKPFEIEAIQWTGRNGIEIQELTGRMSHPGHLYAFQWTYGEAQVWDCLQRTWVNVNVGDWIIKGMKGEFYPCDDEVFKAKYEAIDE